MQRWKQLENAVEKYLKLKKYSFLRIENYRCFKCGQVQNSKAKGFPDFFIYSPVVIAVEVKTGKGRLTGEQKDIALKMESAGIKYIIVRDNIDKLMEAL